MPWAKDTAEGAVISVKAHPRSSKCGIDGVAGDALKVRVRSAPVDGKANKELAETVAEAFGIAKSRVEFASGESSKSKRLLLRGVTAAEAVARISKAALAAVFLAFAAPFAAMAEGMMLLTFDDPNWERWAAAIPLFEKYGAHASFFPNGPLDDRALECLKALHDAGHTVGPHTLHHANFGESFAGKDGMERYYREEIKPQMDMFAKVGIVPIAMAYPNNRHNPEIDAFLALKGFRRVRCGQRNRMSAPNKGTNVVSHADVDQAFRPLSQFPRQMAIEGFGVGEYYSTDIDDLLKAIDRAAERNEFFAIFSHNISPDAKGVNMKLEWLERILARAHERGVAMLGMAELPPPAPAFSPEAHADEVAEEIISNVAKLRAADPLAEPIAFWDFDGTVIKGDMSDGLSENGVTVYSGLVVAAIEAGYSSVYRGKGVADDFHDREYRAFRNRGRWLAWPMLSQIFKGADAESLEGFSFRYARAHIAPWVFASSRRIMDRLATAGIESQIISASPDVFVKPVAAIVGIDRSRAVGIGTAIVGGRITDMVVYPTPMNEGKVDVLRRIVCARPHAYAVAAFGDKYWTDGPFMKYVVSSPLPGGAKGVAMMVNCSEVPPGYEGMFRNVEQKAVVGGRR